MRIPRAMQGHRIDVELYLGASANGPVYGPVSPRRCLVEGRRRSARTPDGRTVASGSVIRTDLDYRITPEARVTYRGQPAEIVAVTHYDGGGLGTPDHTEITVQ